MSIDYRPSDDTFLLDGRPLSAWDCILGEDGVAVGASTTRLTRTSIPGRYGILDQSGRDAQGRAMDDQGIDVTVQLLMLADETDQRSLKASIGALKGMRTSMWWQRMWTGEYRGTLQVGAWEDVWLPGIRYLCSTVTLTLSCDDDLQHAPMRRHRLEAGENTIPVLGNRIAAPTVTLIPDADAASVSLSDGTRTVEYRPATPFDGVRTLTIDCASQTGLYGATPLAPTLDSDWPTLTPDRTVITVANATGWLSYEPLTAI